MKQTKEEYDVVESRTIQAGRFQIVCDTVRESGRDYPYSYVKIKDCAAVLCIVEQSVLLLRQYRHTLRSWEYEIPAGSVEDGENTEEAAKREVMEETGYDIKEMVFLGWYHLSVGSTTERVFLYYALCHKQKKQKLDVLEKIQLYRVPFEEFEGLMDRNEFHQCMGVAAWERYKTANSGNGGR